MSLLSELRAVAEGSDSSYSDKSYGKLLSLDELAEQYPLDEAYFGKRPVEKIQEAMDKIYRLVMIDPDIVLQDVPESQMLEQAIIKVFGFKTCSIYWANRAGLMAPSFRYGKITVPGSNGPCTLPRVAMFHPFDKNFRYGSFENGFYDKDHVLHVSINMDQTLFTIGELSSAEAVAIILHEIGHNFDHTIWSVAKGWAMIGKYLYDISGDMPREIAIAKGSQIAFSIILSHIPKGLYYATNMDDIINNMIPPLGKIIRLVGKVQFNLSRIIVSLFTLKEYFFIPRIVMLTPFRYFVNTFLRKSETYADSFAASYGYAPELVSALEKLSRYVSGDPTSDTPILNILYDIGNLYIEIVNLCYGGHGTTQQRSIRMMEKLRRDIKESGLNSNDSKVIYKELDRLEQFHKSYINMDEDRRKTMTGMFRKLMDAWMNGSSYKVTGNLINFQTYSK